VAVGIVVMEIGKYKNLLEQSIFQAGKDSKKLTPKKRTEYFSKIKELKGRQILSYGVFFESNNIIDKFGITGAIKMAIKKGLKNLSADPVETQVLLDGWLKAPEEYLNQNSIVRGDESELVISLASIAAKVSRDQLMVELALDYPVYGLEKHKGYGTKFHLETLKKYGYSDIHRQSFLKHFKFIACKQ
jgi:ribonuclease HII